MRNVIFQLETLTCPSCIKKIESALHSAKGVSEAKVRFNVSKVVVVYDEHVTEARAIEHMLVQLGFGVIKVIQKEMHRS